MSRLHPGGDPETETLAEARELLFLGVCEQHRPCEAGGGAVSGLSPFCHAICRLRPGPHTHTDSSLESGSLTRPSLLHPTAVCPVPVPLTLHFKTTVAVPNHERSLLFCLNILSSLARAIKCPAGSGLGRWGILTAQTSSPEARAPLLVFKAERHPHKVMYVFRRIYCKVLSFAVITANGYRRRATLKCTY